LIFTTNYGRAAALELLGERLPPVASGHNQYFLWGVRGAPDSVVAYGGDVDDYRRDFGEVELAGRTPSLPHGMPYGSGTPIYLLRKPRRPVHELFEAGARDYQ